MSRQPAILIAAVLLALGYAWLRGAFVGSGPDTLLSAHATAGQTQGSAAPAPAGLARATFAGGCFWCVEADFDKIHGVVRTTSGYTGGRVANPTYEQVSRGGTGHAEAVEILYDPRIVTYEQLLDHYWRNVDPFVAHRQFCDVGDQYRPEIFVHSPEQRRAAEASRQRVQARFKQPIVVRITDAGPFYPAEAYHQDYYKTHLLQYRYYRWRCGRDARLAEIWGDEAR